jgi:hypothetical protein
LTTCLTNFVNENKQHAKQNGNFPNFQTRKSYIALGMGIGTQPNFIDALTNFIDALITK